MLRRDRELSFLSAAQILDTERDWVVAQRDFPSLAEVLEDIAVNLVVMLGVATLVTALMVA